MKVIIAGGRYYDDYETVKVKCDFYLSNVTEEIEIISGRCITGKLTFTTDDGVEVFGADGLGKRYAKENGYKVAPFPADWSLGKVAGRIRNKRMAVYGNALIAFWDKVSRGTKSMIDIAKECGLKVKVVTY